MRIGFLLSTAALLCAASCAEKDMDARRGPRDEPLRKPPEQRNLDRFDDAATIPGFPDFKLTLLDDENEVQDTFKTLRTDLTNDIWNTCSERAHIWAYEKWRKKNIDSGKVFLFYSATEVVGPDGKVIVKVNAGNPTGKNWIWHAAPYVATKDKKLWVLEKFQYVKRPIGMREWLRLQSNGAECIELLGTEKQYSKWTCGKVESNGECSTAPPDLIRVPKDGPKCFFRRVPEYYLYPRDIANHDYLGLPGIEQWNESGVYDVCTWVMGGSDEEKRVKCAEIISRPEFETRESLTSQPTAGRTQFR